jgi:hypothetical protein
VRKDAFLQDATLHIHLGKWDLWWTKWHRDRLSPSTSVFPAKTIHSTNFSIIITIQKYKRKMEVPPIGEGSRFAPFK